MADIILETKDLRCSRLMQTEVPSIVNGVDLRIERGSRVQFFGPPRSGKNLLLQLLGLLERPDSGSIRLLGEETAAWSEDQRSAFRSRHFGFLFSSPYLLPGFSVVENVAMPLFKIAGTEPAQAGKRTTEMLEMTGIADKAQEPADRLDLAAQQRVALARALVNPPIFLIAENPGAALSSCDHADFLALVGTLGAELGLTVLWAGGSEPFPGWRAISMHAGCLSEEAAAITPGLS